jgi:hypothetical protein
MTSEILCNTCENRIMDIKSGLLCNLTGMKPDYKEECKKYVEKLSLKNHPQVHRNYSTVPNPSAPYYDTGEGNPIEKWNVDHGYLRIFLDALLFLFFAPIIFIVIFKGNPSTRDIVIMIIVSTAPIAAIYDIIKRIHYLNNRANDPLHKYLSKYGNYDQVCRQVYKEFEQKSIRFHRIYITPNWIINKRLTKFWILNLLDIVWCYYHVIKSNTGNSHYLKICDKFGVEHMLICKNKNCVSDIITLLNQRHPEIIFGYDDERKRLWQTNPEIFTEEVNYRRRFSS